jgi:hypothetical protein
MRHGHAPGPGRQSASAPVPAHRGPGGDQPHGLQQRRAGAVRRAPVGPEGQAAPGRRRRQYRGQQGRGRPRRRLCHRPDPPVGPVGLFHRQHLLAQHAGPARPADQGGAGGSAGQDRRGARPAEGGRHGRLSDLPEGRPRPGGRRGRGHRRDGRRQRPERDHRQQHHDRPARRPGLAPQGRKRRPFRQAAAGRLHRRAGPLPRGRQRPSGADRRGRDRQRRRRPGQDPGRGLRRAALFGPGLWRAGPGPADQDRPGRPAARRGLRLGDRRGRRG